MSDIGLVQVGVRMPETVLEQLDAEAERRRADTGHNTSRSDLLREGALAVLNRRDAACGSQEA